VHRSSLTITSKNCAFTHRRGFYPASLGLSPLAQGEQMTKTTALLSGLLVLATGVQARAEYFDNSELYHRIGEASGGWWESKVYSDYCSAWGCSSGSWNASTYGPYTTNVAPGDALAITTFLASPVNSTGLRWRFQIFDANSQQVLSSRAFNQAYNPPYSGHHYQVLLPFVSSPGQNIEARTYHYGIGELDQCGVHLLNERDDKTHHVNPVTDQAHRMGYPAPHAEDTAWEVFCTEGQTCAIDHMSFGPYWNHYNDRIGTGIALFNLLLGNTDVGAGAVVDIDVTVRDNGVLRTIAWKRLTASDFPSRWTETKIPLMFDIFPSYYQYEYRVFWHGRGLVQQRAVKVFDPRTGLCMW
jgi:hypothetical protein